MLERSFHLEAIQATWLAHVSDVLSGGEQEARRDFSRGLSQERLRE
jgi:hypothetical protein